MDEETARQTTGKHNASVSAAYCWRMHNVAVAMHGNLWLLPPDVAPIKYIPEVRRHTHVLEHIKDHRRSQGFQTELGSLGLQ